MTNSPEHIFPEFSRMLGRDAKEALLGQRGVVVWLYGLSGSGKSTLANALERRYHAAGRLTQILDGDNIRSGLNADLGFTEENRSENIRRIAEVAKLFKEAGIITITSFITPREDLREQARRIIGADDLVEVFVKADFETCARRDVKGLYAKAAAGGVKNFTGKDQEFEEPQAPDIVLDTDHESEQQSLARLEEFLEQRLAL
jgi:adenylylsulfate kinase